MVAPKHVDTWNMLNSMVASGDKPSNIIQLLCNLLNRPLSNSWKLYVFNHD